MRDEMDFIEWCDQVLDVLIALNKQSREIRLEGFSMEDVAESIYGDDSALASGYQGNPEMTAVRQALSVLDQEGRIEVKDFWARSYGPFLLTRAGREGVERWHQSWIWDHLDQLEEDELALISSVNRFSEIRTERYSYCKPIPIEMILEDLDWQTTPERFEIALRDLGGHALQGGYIGFHIGDGNEVTAISATYWGLVRLTRVSEVEALQRQFEQSFSTPTHTSTDEYGDAVALHDQPSFSFMPDDELRELLTADYLEAKLALNAGAFKASALLSSGVIEGLLYSALSDPNMRSNDGFNTKWKELSKSRFSGAEPRWNRLSLPQLIALAQASGLMEAHRINLISGVMEYRDTSHAVAALNAGARPSREDAALLLAAADSVRACIENYWVRRPIAHPSQDQ